VYRRSAATLSVWLRTYSAVLFADHRGMGLACLLATCIFPRTALGGVAGLALGELVAITLKISAISRPRMRVNALLTGLALSSLWLPYAACWIVFPLAVIGAAVLSVVFQEWFWRLGELPSLSLSFTFAVWIASFSLGGWTPAIPAVPFDFLLPLDELPRILRNLLLSLGWLLFSPHPLAGLLLLIGLAIVSRYLAMLAVLGFLVGSATAGLLPFSTQVPTLGFTSVLTAIAIGGVFCVPSFSATLVACIAVSLATLTATAINSWVLPNGMLALSAPFFLATAITLSFLRHAKSGVMLALTCPALPEQHVEALRAARSRLGPRGSVALSAPFSGEWKVYQSFDGEHTHRGPWRNALDFFIEEEGQSFRHDATVLANYFCFGLPVLAPIAGQVVSVFDGVPDNLPGEVNLRENWGNYVLLRSWKGAHVLLAHLKQGSAAVWPGAYVSAGSVLGSCGNSGRSAQPHLHLHVQASAWIGSHTLPFHLAGIYSRENNAAPVWRAHHVPSQGALVSGALLNPLLSKALTIPAGRRFQYRAVATRAVNYGIGRFGHDHIDWILTTSIELLGELKLAAASGAYALAHCAHSFAMYGRGGPRDAHLDLYFLALGLTPATDAERWFDEPPARLFPASISARFAIAALRPLGARLHSSYERRWDANKNLWRQTGTHTLLVLPGWREVYVTVADISPDMGVMRIGGHGRRLHTNLELSSISQLPDAGIPAWDQKISPGSAQKPQAPLAA